jgi:hypothetical protein
MAENHPRIHFGSGVFLLAYRDGEEHAMRGLKDVIIIAVAGIALIYLVNPTAGILELIPDNLPVLGNLDEAGATLILLNTLAYYGMDVSRLFGSRTGELPKRDENQSHLKG